jgi:3-oxoacyl-[acyl-carrier protein] reductase
MIEIEKKKVLITGASGGIGAAIASKLISEGYHVFNIDKIEPGPTLNETFFPVDLLDIDKLQNTMKLIQKEKDVIAFVHCAGYGGPFHPITDVGIEEWDNIFTINVKSAYIVLKNLLNNWKSIGFGRFIAIASSQSIIGARNSVAYSASKHSVIGMVKSLSDEWGSYGITCNAISPGYVRTNMGIQEEKLAGHYEQVIQKTPSKRIAEPWEIARIVSFMLSEDSGYINGANWTVDGGITAI